MHLPFYDAKSAAKVECQQTLERFADFDTAGGVGGGGEGGGEGLGGSELGLPHGGAGGFGGEGAGGVLPAFGEAGVGGGLEVFQQFVGEVGAVTDEDDVAAGGEGGEGADVGLEFGDAAGVLGQGVVAVAFDAAVAGEVFATGFHAALGEAAL